VIAIEIIHYLKSKTKGNVALKVDMSKAYEHRINWEYLRKVMLRLGFDAKWVGWIMMRVESVKYKVLVNQESEGHILPGRGLRQGDPLSPYLFILCAQGLTSLIDRAEGRGDLYGVRVCIGPFIHSPFVCR